MNPGDAEREAIEEAAAEWLARRDRRFTAEEAVAFACWRRADSRHEAAVAEFEQVWATLDALSAVNGQQRAGGGSETSPAPESSTSFPSPRSPADSTPARRPPRARRWTALGLAAAVAVLTVWWVEKPVTETELNADRFETVVGAQRTVVLADGTDVWLNTNTALSVRLGPAGRQVTLERGEAFFRVTRDPARPFVVAFGRAEARVLGTAFSVRLQDEAGVVLVTEGEVRCGATGSAGAMLRARQQAILVSGANRPRVETLTVEAVALRLAWQSGRIEFTDTPLGEAIAEFNRYHAERLVVHDASTAAVRVGGSVAVNNLDGFVRLLDTSFDVVVVRRDAGEIVLGLRP